MAKHLQEPTDATPRPASRRRTIARVLTVIPVLVAIACAILSHSHVKSVGGTYDYLVSDFPGEQFAVENVTVTPPEIATVQSVTMRDDGSSVITFTVGEDGRGAVMVGNENGGMMVEALSRGGILAVDGSFTGWETVLTSLVIVSAVSGIICVIAFLLLMRDAWYGYEMAGYAGFGLFFLTQATWFSTIALTGSATTFSDLMSGIITIADHFVELLMVPTAIAAAFVIVSNIALTRHEGRGLTNLLGVLASIAWIIAVVAWRWLDKVAADQMEMTTFLLLWSCGSLMAVIIAYGLSLLIGVSATAWLAARHRPSMPRDYLVVLGCGLRDDGSPTPLLAGRVDAARSFMAEQVAAGLPAPTIVASGGKGADERWSEAEAMTRYLEAQGESCRVLMEKSSTNTRENLAFSAKVIARDALHKGHLANEMRVAFATTNYHVLRGYVYAHAAGLDAEGIASPTKLYFWPNAFLREFVGLIAARAVPILVSLVCVMLLYLLALYVTISGSIPFL